MTLLHVVAPPLGAWSSPEGAAYSSLADLLPERLAERTAKLEAFLAGEMPGIRVQRVVVEGDPAQEIVAYAHTRQVDLIVMPTHGYGPFRRFLLGSVTAKVLHDAACPVWTGPHLEQAPAYQSISFRKVVCAIDLGPDTSTVLAWAASFAREFAGQLAIVHVLPVNLTRLDGIYFAPEWRQHVASDAADRIAALQQELHLTAEVSIESGDVPATVADLAQSLSADVLVIGRGRRPGVLGRLRTNAYAILRESPCPVVTV
jgi:nucleotide-binding universal stress UspA family protein